MAEKVSFGVSRKATLASALQGAAPVLGVAPSLCSYFRMSSASTTIILPNGERRALGDKIPFWVVTEDTELADYLRDNFVGVEDTGIQIAELDEYAYRAAHTLIEEVLPVAELKDALADVAYGQEKLQAAQTQETPEDKEV